MKKRELLDLVKLTVMEDGEISTKIYHQLRDDLGDERLRKILGHMNKVAKIIAEAINELEGENENE